MQSERYKDIKATLILLGIICLPVSTWIIGRYTSDETKLNILIGIFVLCGLALVFAIWKLIRAVID
jgi:uncharacterized membrane protein